jgi:hypothetical protein
MIKYLTNGVNKRFNNSRFFCIMVIEFNKEGDEEICLKPGIARVSLGLSNEKKLHYVMSVINSATTLLDLQKLYPKTHWLQGNRRMDISVPLQGGKRLILRPVPAETREWNKITKVKFVEITDYHK